MYWPIPTVLSFGCAFVLYLFFTYLIEQIKLWKKFINLTNQFPGPKPSYYIGSAFDYLVPRADLPKVFDSRFKTYGSIIRVWNITNVVADIFISKPDYLEVILTSTKHIRKGEAYRRLHSWLGTGLLTSTGSKWHQHRKLLTPAFHFKILEDFFNVFVEKTNVLVDILENQPSDSVTDLMPLLSKCTLDIICETAMGTHMNIQQEEKHEPYVNAIYNLTELISYRELRPWFHSDILFYNSRKGKQYKRCLQIAHELTRKVIEEKKALKKNTNASSKLETHDSENLSNIYRKKRLALLDLLLELQDREKALSDNDIQEEVDTFMFEGHDTTAMGLTWTLYMLGLHPKCQDEAFKEQEDIFGESSRDPTTDDLHNMKYLERVIKESLRHHPSVPFIGRRIEEDLKLDMSYTIPAGSNVIIDIFHTHMDPDHYSNPDKFDPDNFLPERSRLRHPYAYIPFSAGPRNCIGQKFALLEEKTILSKIIRTFKVESVEEIIKVQEVVTKPLNGLHVKLTKRVTENMSD